MGTAHNNAPKDKIAKSVLMPGDPKRAKYIADNFLENAELVNDVRGIGGYTGTYNGKMVTVMASGMGIPSIGIYSYELYKFYDVENIVRIGSAGSFVEDVKLFDVVLATSAYSQSSFGRCQNGDTADTLYPSEELVNKLRKASQDLNIPVVEAGLFSGDVFYADVPYDIETLTKEKHCVAAEMESFGLFHNAKALGKNAACLVTISDSIITHEETTHEQREKGLIDMIKIALTAITTD